MTQHHTYQHWNQAKDILLGIEGHIVAEEADWLYRTAAACRIEGQIVEIGSFKGKSTVALAKGIEISGNERRVVAIDPHCAPSSTDPVLGEASSEPDLRANLTRAGVNHLVDIRVQYSLDAVKDCDSPISLLWLDGDHTVEGISNDFQQWVPHLSEGGILAMHDVLHTFKGPARVFLDGVLRASGWTAIGFIKSIGFAQKAIDIDFRQHARVKRMAAILERMIALSDGGKRLSKPRYKLYRSLILHL